MTTECNSCGGPLDVEPVPTDTDNLPPTWYLEGTCANCAFEKGAEEHYAKLDQPVSLEEYRDTHGHLYYRDPGCASPEREAEVMAENQRLQRELDAQAERAPDA